LYAQNARARIGTGRGGKMPEISIENIQIMAQIAEAMNDSLKKLENYYEKRDIENFNKSKNAILGFQKQIDKILT
jgi:hypothetical protein